MIKSTWAMVGNYQFVIAVKGPEKKKKTMYLDFLISVFFHYVEFTTKCLLS